jgi:hypothetical protein
VLYVYSAGDPNTAYGAISVGAREYAITAQWAGNCDYINLHDLELRCAKKKLIYSVYGKDGYTNDNWTIERVVAHHVGSSALNDVGGMDIAGSHYVIRNCTIFESTGNGMVLRNCANVIVEYTTSYNNHHHQFDCKAGSDGDMNDNNTIRYCTAYTSGISPNVGGISDLVHGIGIGCDRPARNTHVCYNLVYDIPDNGIQVDNSARDAEVANNTVVNAGGCDFYIACGTAALTLKNNIGVNAGGDKLILRVIDTTNKTIDYNCWYATSGSFAEMGADSVRYSDFSSYKSATGFDAHSLNVDPMFVNAAEHDFHLQAQSPCMDKGAATGLTKEYPGCAV